MLHTRDLRKPRNVVGLVMLLGVEAFSTWAECVYSGHRVFLIGMTAWLLTAYILTMTVWFNVEAWRAERKDEKTDAPNEAATPPASMDGETGGEVAPT
jgi:hypothetical protein